MAENRRDISQRFDVVHQRGLAPQSMRRGIGWADARFTALALNRFNQGSFFAANVSAGSGMDMDVKVEITVEQAFTEETKLARLGDGVGQALLRKGIFPAHIDIGLHQRQLHNRRWSWPQGC